VLAFENNSFTLYMECKQTSVNGFILLDIIQDYFGLNVNVIISVISALFKTGVERFFALCPRFYAEILQQQSRLFICDNFC